MQSKFYSSEKNVQILVALLKAHGIKKGVISPGITNVCFVGSVQQDPYFELYSAADERSAAYIACGMAAESGEPVFLSCTGATASRNYVPGLTEAYYRHLPVIAITSTQFRGRIGHDIAQVIDRSEQLNDIVYCSVQAPMIHTAEEAWSVNTDINKALLELNHRAGGPVHINLETTYSPDFSVEKLPETRVIHRVMPQDEFPAVPQGKIAIWIGSHRPFSLEVTQLIEQFCEQYNAVVVGDHTSNYRGKYYANMHLSRSQDVWGESVCQKVDLLIHLGDVSGGYLGVQSQAVWRVHPDGRVCDTFQQLRRIFEMDEKTFFTKILAQGKGQVKTDFARACQQEHEEFLSLVPELPFSNDWIARNYSMQLPAGSALHLGILNSLRSWNFFDLPQSVTAFSNTGGFGIDGNLSSLLGAALAAPDKLFFGVIGDLAFFYDMNALGNRHLCPNLRLMMINNGVGTEFKNYMHPVYKFEQAGDAYMAAAGHYGNQSPKLVRGYAEALGCEYICAANKDEFRANAARFFSPQATEHPMVFEIFTNPPEESEALYMLHHLKISAKGKTKQVIRDTLGAKNVQRIKSMLGR